MRKLLTLLFLPIVAFAMMGASALPASAAIAETTANVVVQEQVSANGKLIPDGCMSRVCTGEDAAQQDKAFGGSQYLPTNRWSSMEFHNRLNGWDVVGSSNANLSSFLTSGIITGGNFVWNLATSFSRNSMAFDPYKTEVGYSVDKVAGVIGDVLIRQPIIFGTLAAALIIFIIYRAANRPGSKPFGKVLQAGLVMGLIVMMGSQASAGTQADFNRAYTPKPGSPVYLAKAVTDTIDTAAGALVSGVSDRLVGIVTDTTTGDSGNSATAKWNCGNFIEAGFEVAKKSGAVTPGAEAVSRSLNMMWISTAYSTYSAVQFGDANHFAPHVACRQLERTTSVDTYTRIRIHSQAQHDTPDHIPWRNPSEQSSFSSYLSPMLHKTTDNDEEDAVLVAWAACQPTNARGTEMSVRGAFSKWITPEHCKTAFRIAGNDKVKDIDGGVFNVESVDVAKEKSGSDEGVMNFIKHLHSRDALTTLTATTSAVVFFIGSLLSGGLFIFLGAATMGAKIGMLLLSVAMFFILIATLFRSESLGQSMRKPMSRFLGVAFFAFGSTLLLALLSIASLVIASLGGMFGTKGSVLSIFFVSLSPIIAAVVVHLLFKNVFGKASPMTPAGMFAWGSAGGAVGAGVGTAWANQHQNRAVGAAKAAGREMLQGNKYTSWIPGIKQSDARKGAGDAGARKNMSDLGGDLTSQQIAGGGAVPAAGAGLAGLGLSGGAGTAGAVTSGAGAGAGGAGAAVAGADLAAGMSSLSASRSSDALRAEPLPAAGEHGYIEPMFDFPEGEGAPVDGAAAAGAEALGGAAGAAVGAAAGVDPAAAAAAAREATKHLSHEARRQLERDARKKLRGEDPGLIGQRMAAFQGKMDSRRVARSAALGEVAGDLGDDSLLTPEARAKALSFTNSSDGGAVPGWDDLTPRGRAQAQVEAARKRKEAARERREARQQEAFDNPNVARRGWNALNMGVAQVHDDPMGSARAAVGAGVTGAKAAGGAYKSADAAVTAAAAAGLNKSLAGIVNVGRTSKEAAKATGAFLKSPEAMKSAAANGAAAAKAGAARSPYMAMEAARKSSAAAVNGAQKTREVAQKASQLAYKASTLGTGNEQVGKVVRRTAAIAGAGAVAVAAPVVLVAGATTYMASRKGAKVTSTVATKARDKYEVRTGKRAAIDEIMVALATERKYSKPRTSTVSPAAPVVTQAEEY